jgi:hypothetical protein
MVPAFDERQVAAYIVDPRKVNQPALIEGHLLEFRELRN